MDQRNPFEGKVIQLSLRVRRACAQLRRGSESLRIMVLSLLQEAYPDDPDIHHAFADSLFDNGEPVISGTSGCTPSDAGMAWAVVRLLDASGAVQRLPRERIDQLLKALLAPGFAEDRSATTRIAMQLWQRQRGYLRSICKKVYNYYALTNLFETYLEQGTNT